MHNLYRLRAVAVVAVCSVVLAACTSSQSSTLPHPAAQVKTQLVSSHNLDETSTFMGNLRSRRSAVLQPLVSGTVTKIFVKSGEVVQKDQPIIEIDPEKAEANLRSYEAANSSSEADLVNAQQTLASLKATRVSKQSNFDFNKKEVSRYRWLSQQGAVSVEQADQYANNLKVAEADLQIVDAQIKAQDALIKKMEKQREKAGADEKQQKVQLKYYTVRAPFAGMVSDIPLRLGEYVESQTKITTVTENHPLEVYINVPAEKGAHLHKGMPVQLVSGTGTVIGTAQVFFVSPDVDQASQTVLVKAEYPNSDDLLRSNQAISARIVWSSSDGLTVPTFAVSHIAAQDFVFVVEGKAPNLVAKQKPVSLGEIAGNEYKVKSGLKAGEQVIVSGLQTLIDGAAITIQQ